MKTLLKIIVAFFGTAVLMMLFILWTCRLFNFNAVDGAVFTGSITFGALAVILTLAHENDIL